MIDAPISRVRLRALACLGRCERIAAGGAGLHPSAASRRQRFTDATGIGETLPPRPRAASSRPDTDDLVASII